ncbi:hypothetical protein TEA_029985 [Camellia sinensis var. sinensis]|uniref:tRNA (adenine(58)-N(1))-methyltransferase n=1 Tax=Camellia sinensis var. sinensis TaxID=542762 RepID=A0A4S4CZP4_CAMSN|nr:hypothetical protein TEA_029985 [Camellia sinensis var. sinensis]
MCGVLFGWYVLDGFRLGEDFERTGLSNVVTVGVRDIQRDDFCGKADSVFLDLPQPWLAIPSAGKILKQDAILCSFSLCIEQAQHSCETLQSNFPDIRTFEVLLRMYEVREGKTENFQANDSVAFGSLPCKRRHGSNEGSNASSLTIMVRPSAGAKGHTGYLTFARLGCLS